MTALIESDPRMQVVDYARNGADGVEKAKRLKPDLVTMDIEMPVLDGLSALSRMRVECEDPKPAVVICSSLTTSGSAEALKAMRLGAADVIAKDPEKISLNASPEVREELVARLWAIADGRARRSRITEPAAPARLGPDLRIGPGQVDILTIGSSTGGPPVLEQVLSALPPEYPVPIVVAQHMPELFTRSLSHRLDEQCQISVVHADRNVPLVPGTAYVIRGGAHGLVQRTPAGRLGLTIKTDGCESYLYKPSADLLFESTAKAVGGRCLAMVMTGMGDDGSRGAAQLASEGARILTQSESTCVVYGMPKAVASAGLSSGELSPAQLADAACLLASESERHAA